MIPLHYEITDLRGHYFFEIGSKNDALISLKNNSSHHWLLSKQQVLQIHFRPGTVERLSETEITFSKAGKVITDYKKDTSANVLAINTPNDLELAPGQGFVLALKSLNISALGGSRSTQIMCNILEKGKTEAIFESVRTVELLHASSTQQSFSAPLFELEAIQKHHNLGTTEKFAYLFAVRLHPSLAPYLALRGQDFSFNQNSQLRIEGKPVKKVAIWFEEQGKQKALLNYSSIVAYEGSIEFTNKSPVPLNTDGVLFTVKVHVHDQHEPQSGKPEDEVYMSYNNIPGLPLGRLRVPISDHGHKNPEGRVLENFSPLLPAGSIVMWSGSRIPSGWALCDGTDGRPDLIGRFVMGAQRQPSYPNDRIGGHSEVTLSEAHLPRHKHHIDFWSSTQGSHRHELKELRVRGNEDGSNQFTVSTHGGDKKKHRSDFLTDYQGNHSHHVHGDTGYIGSSHPIDITPKYYKLAYIIKL